MKHLINHSVKKIFITLIMLFTCIAISFGQDTTSPANRDMQLRKHKEEVREEKRLVKELENLPYEITQDFRGRFPVAKEISWIAAPDYFEADFTMDNSDMMAFYDFDNALIGFARNLSYDQLPQKALENIGKHYPGYTPEKIIYYDNNEDNAEQYGHFWKKY